MRFPPRSTGARIAGAAVAMLLVAEGAVWLLGPREEIPEPRRVEPTEYFPAEQIERARELLDAFSLAEKRRERIRTLSGGMKRRLVLARALMHRPRLLILDEPTAGVDVELRLELWHYVQRINGEGTTILLTTHYLEEAEQLCDRIAFINEGQIVAQGTSDELADRYGVASLEDAYLELVGRKELSRAHIGSELP